MVFHNRAIWLTCRGFLLLGFLAVAGSAGAQSSAHLTYPQAWCQSGYPQPLHFTMEQLGAANATLAAPPSHGEVALYDQPAEGGYYLPDCAGILRAGFDFFQLKQLGGGGLTNVVVHASEGASTLHVVEEKAEGGKLGEGWTFGGGPGVRIVEWSGSDGLEGSHGFRADGAQIGDSYVSFSFPDAFGVQQPPDGIGDNQGTVTTVIIRPPTTPPFGETSGEQLIYSTGDFATGAAPDTALRLRSIAGELSVRAEARVASEPFEVVTPWCDLQEGNNEIQVYHRHSLDHEDYLKLSNVVGGAQECDDTVDGFTSAATAAAEHRFGIMEPQQGGIAFDFDDMRIESARYETQLVGEVIDDFESGAWSNRWTMTGSSGVLDVAAESSHTGFWGLRIRPELATSTYLLLHLPSETSDLGCHFSLGGDGAMSTPSDTTARTLVFSARGTGGDRVRLWLRQASSGHEIRAHSPPHQSAWLPLPQLPAALDLRWQSGLLELWIDGCGPDPEHCGVPHQVGSSTTKTANRLRLGDIQLTEERSESITVDNVLCLRGRASEGE